MAMSSLVPAPSNTEYARPSCSRRTAPGASPPGYACTTSLAPQHLSTIDADEVALGDVDHHLGTGLVDQRDARRGQEQWSHVGVTTGDEAARVHDCRDSGEHEVLGRDPVEVVVVDDRDVARLE